MDALRKRYTEVKLADVARNTLLDDMFQKVNDMQKSMDRSAFVMVLIDGDCMNVCTVYSATNLIMCWLSTSSTRLTFHQVLE